MKARSLFRWRTLRWAALAAVAPVLWACNSRSLEAPIVAPTSTFKNTFQETLNRKIDILFMIDNSSSMELSQANLTRNLKTFMDVLKGLPDGLPDVHIAIVTSDMGAGDGSITGCGGNGNNGVFQYTARQGQGLPACTDSTLMGGATYISSTGGQNPQKNFSAADITTVFQCIAPVGASGCGFEHQLASVARALGADGAPPPGENQGFLRPEAYLAIVFITNEDDCSAPVNSSVFETSVNTNLASMIGPPANFRCNEWGHLCDGMKPPRLSPNPGDLNTVQTLQNCISSETSGLLTPVDYYATGIKGLKADPTAQILVASIQGLPTSYTIKWNAPPTNDTGPWPQIQHSCTSTDGSFADPGVRMQQFVKAFGGNGSVFNVCDADYTMSLNTIAMKLSALIGPKCITGQVSSRSASDIPDCSVTDVVPKAGTNDTIQSVVPACADNGNSPPCWSLSAPGNGQNCPNGSHVVTVNRGGMMPADNLRNAVECVMCIGGKAPDASRTCL